MLIHLAVSDFKRFCQANNTIDVLRSSTHVAFLSTTVNEGLHLFFLTHIHETHSFRSMKLVSPGSNTMNFELLQIMTVMPYCLNGIGMKVCIIMFAQFTYRSQVKQIPDFIVCVHQ